MKPKQIREFAHEVHPGERSLLRRFTKAAGRSPARYLQAVCIEYAKRLPESTQHTVEEIILENGYSDAPSFFRCFRFLTGRTPGEYRACFSVFGKE